MPRVVSLGSGHRMLRLVCPGSSQTMSPLPLGSGRQGVCLLAAVFLGLFFGASGSLGSFFPEIEEVGSLLDLLPAPYTQKCVISGG